MNAIDFLIKEHHHAKKVFDQIDNASHRDDTKRKMFETLCSELLRHEAMEHQVWYPHFKDNKGLNATVKHLFSEEKAAERILNQFDGVLSQEEWDEKFNKLKRDVEKHAKDEEELLFPQVRKILSKEELEQIGLDMFHFKSDYESSH